MHAHVVKFHRTLAQLSSVGLALAALHCTSSDLPAGSVAGSDGGATDATNGGSGGSAGTSGADAAGGAGAMGGATGDGGAGAMGGATGDGGAGATGGATGDGGASAAGGASGADSDASSDAGALDASADSNPDTSVGPIDADLGATDSRAPDVLTGEGGTWHLVWADEFDGPAVNPANWTIVDTQNPKNEIYNNELQAYKPANVSIVGGALAIEAREEGSVGQRYTSGKLTSETLQSFKYGKFIARIKLPATPAMWPAFWGMGISGGWPQCGEIDVMEARGRVPTETSGALHWGNGSMAGQTNTFPATTDLSDWHEYVAEWDATTIALSVDGTPFFSMAIGPTNSFDQPFYLMLNLAVGGDFDHGVTPPPNMTPRRMYVDYVRVYQR